MRTIGESALCWLFLWLSDAAGFLRMPRLEWVLLFWSADMEEYHGGPSPRHLRPWRQSWKDACALEALR